MRSINDKLITSVDGQGNDVHVYHILFVYTSSMCRIHALLPRYERFAEDKSQKMRREATKQKLKTKHTFNDNKQCILKTWALAIAVIHNANHIKWFVSFASKQSQRHQHNSI